MLRLPAVAGQFYPADAKQLAAEVEKYTTNEEGGAKRKVRACLVPHAGYTYSGGVAGAVFSRIALPKTILLLGVRHYPRGEPMAILSEGAWRTPLGDVPIDSVLAKALKQNCAGLREDKMAHRLEHSLEVELPFLQMLTPEFSFVPVAIGTLRYQELRESGEGIARVVEKWPEEVLIVTSSDMNHYEDDETTRVKDGKAIERLLRLDAKGLYETCRDEKVSMCGLGPAVTMLTAMEKLGVYKGELVSYATSGDVNGNRDEVVGYAGMLFG